MTQRETDMPDALKGIYMALDDIFMTISYVNTHGVSAEPYPSPEGGGPQIVPASPDQFWAMFQRIGTLAKEAMATAEAMPGFERPTLDDFRKRDATARD